LAFIHFKYIHGANTNLLQKIVQLKVIILLFLYSSSNLYSFLLWNTKGDILNWFRPYNKHLTLFAFLVWTIKKKTHLKKMKFAEESMSEWHEGE